jgi:pyruvate-ferredoxin/flavodoxin oxidoreductase
MSYGHVYVARVAMGASDAQTVKAFLEAEAYHGPSLIIAYSHCIAHGFDLKYGMQQQKLAVDCGYWPLVRYHPDDGGAGGNPLHLDSRAPKIPLKDFAYRETRYRVLAASDPEEARRLLQLAQQDVNDRWKRLEEMASATDPKDGATAASGQAAGNKAAVQAAGNKAAVQPAGNKTHGT